MAFQPRLVLGGLSPNLPTRQPALSASISACKSVSATSQAKVKKSGDKKSGQRYIASADLSSEYAPLKKRGSNDREYTREEEDSLRKAGAKNIDLWLTPTLYPTDPGTGHLPPVSSIPNLLRWLCEGGLAAYSWALLQAGQQGVAAAQARAQEELGLKATRLQLESDKARREAQAAINQAHGERLLAEQRLQQAEEENERKLREIAKHAACAAATHAEELAKMKQEFAALEREMEASLAHRVSEKEHEMRALLDEKIEELEGLQLVERMLRAEQQKLEQQLNKARQTGGKLRNRVGKDYSDLKKGGGAEKKRRREALKLSAPTTVKKLETAPSQLGKRKRLTAYPEVASSFSQLLGTACTVDMLRKAMRGDRFKKLRQEAGQAALDEVGVNLTAALALAGLELGDGNLKMYRALYNSVKAATTEAGFKMTSMPNPHKVNLERKSLIEEVPKAIGDIEVNRRESRMVHDKELGMDVEETMRDNVWLGTTAAIAQLVKFYSITPEKLNGGPLKMILKLDECAWVNGRKLERLTLTVGTGALDGDMQAWWSVQSEKDIWTLAAFEVAKEDHATLKWQFSFADVADVIKRHNNGETLDVAGVGKFNIEWHLASDLKTLKALYGCKSGPNATYSCLYCMLKRENGQWKGGACKAKQHLPPDRDSDANAATQGSDNWDPILPIPLSRVHICTMHAENRLIEKIIHLHISHVYNSDGEGRAERLAALEGVLSRAGVQGGNAKIEWDEKKKRVLKHSMKDTTVRRFTKKFDSAGRQVGNLWRALLEAEDDPDRRRRVLKQKVWEAVESLAPYLRDQKYRAATGSDPAKFKKVVGGFLRAFVDCWGETHVTHYMHILHAHGDFFVKKYGSLAYWNTQGMEKSHWRAKSIYMRHTQHDGGRERHSALRQMLEFEYRLMTHRLRVAAVAEARSELKRLREIRSEKYKQIWLASIAPERAAEWRAGKRRDGSRWVPIASEEEDLVEEVEEAASTSLDDGMAGDLNVDDLEAELMSQEASLYADGLVLEEQVIAA